MLQNCTLMHLDEDKSVEIKQDTLTSKNAIFKLFELELKFLHKQSKQSMDMARPSPPRHDLPGCSHTSSLSDPALSRPYQFF
jgi:hypothetical protein